MHERLLQSIVLTKPLSSIFFFPQIWVQNFKNINLFCQRSLHRAETGVQSAFTRIYHDYDRISYLIELKIIHTDACAICG